MCSCWFIFPGFGLAGRHAVRLRSDTEISVAARLWCNHTHTIIDRNASLSINNNCFFFTPFACTDPEKNPRRGNFEEEVMRSGFPPTFSRRWDTMKRILWKLFGALWLTNSTYCILSALEAVVCDSMLPNLTWKWQKPPRNNRTGLSVQRVVMNVA